MKRIFLIALLLTGYAYGQDQTIGKRTNQVKVVGKLAVDSIEYMDIAADTVLIQGPGGTIKRGKLSRLINYANCTTTKLSGDIIWISGFNFSNTKLTYQIGCQLDTSSASNFSISSADTFSRYTILWADTLGNLGSTNGVYNGGIITQPNIDPRSQILLATYFIPANSTQPQLVSNTTVYKENQVGEFGGTSNITGVNFAYTFNPYQGLYSTYIPSFTDQKYIYYQDGSDHNINSYTYLSFYVRLETAFTNSNYITVAFQGTSGRLNYATIYNGQFGFNGSLLNQYQLIVLKVSDFTPTQVSTTFNTIVFTFSGSGGVVQFDNIILQSGGSNVSSSGVKTYNGQTDNITSFYEINSDSSYVVHIVNGIRTDSFRILRTVAVAGSNMTITTNAAGDTATFNSTGGGQLGYGYNILNDSSLVVSNDWTTTIQAALDAYKVVYVPYRGIRYDISDRLLIGSNTTLILDRDAEIYLANGTNTSTIRNRNMLAAIPDSNITIMGGIWNGNSANNPNVHTDKTSWLAGVTAQIAMIGVNNVIVKGMNTLSCNGVAFQFSSDSNFQVRDMIINNISDAVHISGPNTHFIVDNIKGRTGDDFIALNAYDWSGYTPLYGDITDGVISNIVSNTPAAGIRFLAGQGATIDNIRVSNFGGYAGKLFYMKFDEDPFFPGATPYKIGSISFDNIYAVGGIDKFLIKNDVTSLSISNITDSLEIYSDSAFLSVANGYTVGSLKISNYKSNPRRFNDLFKIYGTVDNLVMTGITQTMYDDSTLAFLKVKNGGTINNLAIDGMVQKYGNFLLTDTGSAIKNINISNSIFDSTIYFSKLRNNSTTNLNIVNSAITHTTNSLIALNHSGATINAKVANSNYSGGTTLFKQAGSLQFNSISVSVDANILNPQANDLVLNSNAGLTTGILVRDSTNTYWHNLFSSGGSGLTPPNSIKKYLNGYNNYATLNTDSIAEGTTNKYTQWLTVGDDVQRQIGSAKVTNTGYSVAGFQIESTSAGGYEQFAIVGGPTVSVDANKYMRILQYDDATMAIYSASANPFKITTGGSDRVNIDAVGSVGINNSSPHASSIFDVASTTKGVLFPRFNTTQMNAVSSPYAGLIITNTDSLNRLFIYTGSAWKGLAFTSETGGGSSGWGLTGNSGITAGTNFIGTTDAQSLRFRTNNSYRGAIDSLGNWFAGESIGATAYKLNVTGGIHSYGSVDVSGNIGASANIASYYSQSDISGVGVSYDLAPSAKFEVRSTTSGALLPRMTTTQKNAISSPAEGLVVYDLTLHKLCVYTGSAWETVTSLSFEWLAYLVLIPTLLFGRRRFYNSINISKT